MCPVYIVARLACNSRVVTQLLQLIIPFHAWVGGSVGLFHVRMWPTCMLAQKPMAMGECCHDNLPFTHEVMIESSVKANQLNGSLSADFVMTGGRMAVRARGSTGWSIELSI